MLSEETIQKNFKSYKICLIKLVGEEIADRFIDLLGGEDRVARATYSNLLDSGSAYDGSLIKNILVMSKWADKINEILPEKAKADTDSIHKVCFLSQMSKVLLYEENDNNWERANRGMLYKFNNNLQGALRVGERSTFIAINAGIKFNEIEYEAMRIMDKDNGDDNYTKYFSSPLSTVIRQANELITLANRIQKKSDE